MRIDSISIDNAWDHIPDIELKLQCNSYQEYTIITKLLKELMKKGDIKMEESLKKNYTKYISTSTGNIVRVLREQDEPLYGGAFYNNYGKLVYIKRVIYNNPAVVVFWSDNTKTLSKCDPKDTFNPEIGLAIAVMKKLVSPDFVHKTFADWLPVEGKKERTLKEVREDHRKKNK